MGVHTSKSATKVDKSTQTEKEKGLWQRFLEFLPLNKYFRGDTEEGGMVELVEDPQEGNEKMGPENREKCKRKEHKRKIKTYYEYMSKKRRKSRAAFFSVDAECQTIALEIIDKITSTDSALKKSKMVETERKVTFSDNSILDPDATIIAESSTKTSESPNVCRKTVTYILPPKKHKKVATSLIVDFDKNHVNHKPKPTVHRHQKIKFSPTISSVSFSNAESITNISEKDKKKEEEQNFLKRLKMMEEQKLVDLSQENHSTKVSRNSKRTYVQPHVRKTVKRANLELFKAEN